jgi:SagB-type dehydrogenase family enzyme
MKKFKTPLLVFSFLGMAAIMMKIVFFSVTPAGNAANASETKQNNNDHIIPGSMITLPEIITKGNISLEEALQLRRSTRRYSDNSLNISHVSQLLWSAQGITNERGYRTAPSAGATFPLEMFLVANNVDGLTKGLYHYDPQQHSLRFLREEDLAEPLSRACLGQRMLREGAAVLVFAAEFERTTARYGERGIRYVHNEIGHASQNVHLQAAALGLGTVVIGAYRDEEVEALLQLDEALRVLYLMPVGHL